MDHILHYSATGQCYFSAFLLDIVDKNQGPCGGELDHIPQQPPTPLNPHNDSLHPPQQQLHLRLVLPNLQTPPPRHGRPPHPPNPPTNLLALDLHRQSQIPAASPLQPAIRLLIHDLYEWEISEVAVLPSEVFGAAGVFGVCCESDDKIWGVLGD